MLTPKQERFCQEIVSGKDGMTAYKTAYDTKGNSKTVNREAAKLLMRDDITERITELRKPLINHAQNSAISEREKKRNIIWEGIEKCRISGDHNGVARYMDILNKMDAEYININRNIEDNTSVIKDLTEEQLKKIADQA